MKYNIAIAGAGIGGLCAGLALAQRGFTVSVYEQSSVLAEVGAGLQLSPNAMHVLSALGVAEQLRLLAFEPQAAVMRHYKTGKQYFSMPLATSCCKKYGAGYLHIHRADLYQVLHQACLKQGVVINLGYSLLSYQHLNKQVEVKFNNGQQITADMLIGADGIKSKVQNCMLGESNADFTGQVAWRGTVAANKLPKDLIKPNANLWVGPGKHFVSYYLRGGDLVNFVAVQERKDWCKESWNEAGDIQQLQSAFAGWHPEVTELLEATQHCFLWALFDRKPLNQWVDNQVALLGDACHPMLPFLAQGAAMAIEDSYTLANCLTTEKNIAKALQNYQGLRLTRTSQVQIKARKNASLYHMKSPLDRVKLAVLEALSKVGLSQKLASCQLDEIYAYNIVTQLSH